MSTELGRQAEERAAAYLERHGFAILARNWRTRWCELDLVARRGEVIHIVEVKYRSNPAYGSGFDYITTDKRQRLIKAAAAFIVQHAPNADYQIDVVSVEGKGSWPEISLIENAVTM